MRELRQRGVEFTGPPQDHGYGRVTYFKVPGDFEVSANLPQNLATGAARRRWLVGVGHDGNACELSWPF